MCSFFSPYFRLFHLNMCIILRLRVQNSVSHKSKLRWCKIYSVYVRLCSIFFAYDARVLFVDMVNFYLLKVLSPLPLSLSSFFIVIFVVIVITLRVLCLMIKKVAFFSCICNINTRACVVNRKYYVYTRKHDITVQNKLDFVFCFA